MKPPRLTPPLRQQIVAALRAGGYPHVAAAAWGVSPETLDQWLHRGADEQAREPYASFVREVRQASAQARLRAEMAVFEHEPRIWLQHGPGRETDHAPGWSVAVKAAERDAVLANPWMNPVLMHLFHQVLEALAPFPEARSRVSIVLANAESSTFPG